MSSFSAITNPMGTDLAAQMGGGGGGGTPAGQMPSFQAPGGFDLLGHSDFSVTPYQTQMYDPSYSTFVDQNGWNNKQMLAGAQGARNAMGAPQDTWDRDRFDIAGGDQNALAFQLRAQANGQGPSLAGLQLNQGLEQMMAAQRSQAASARGMSPLMAQRMAAQNIAASQGQVNQQAAMARMQEQLNAQGMYSNVLSGMRGQDLSGMQTQLQNQLAAQGQKDDMTKFYTGGMLGLDASQFAANQAYQGLRSNNYNTTQGINSNNYNTAAQINSGVAASNAAGGQKLLGMGLSAGGAVGAGFAGKK